MEYADAPKIEKAQPGDAAAIYDVSRRAWQATYPNAELGITEEDIALRIEGAGGSLIDQKIEQWQQAIETSGEDHDVFVAKAEDLIVGFVVPRVVKGGERRIGAIYVSPEAQGNGYGAALLLSALGWHGGESDIYLHVVAYNRHAIAFYERFGFELTGRVIEERVLLPRDMPKLPLLEMLLPAPGA